MSPAVSPAAVRRVLFRVYADPVAMRLVSDPLAAVCVLARHARSRGRYLARLVVAEASC